MESNANSFRRLLVERTWIRERISNALDTLTLAANYEQETKAKNQFAISIGELITCGICHSDLRLLIRFQIVEHLVETTNENAVEREFSTGNQRFEESSCFRLTDSYLAADACDSINKQASLFCPAEQSTPENLHQVTGMDLAKAPVEAGLIRPKWNELRQELSFDSRIIKRFRSPSPCQISILSVFEEDGWPERIDDPLPPRPDIDPKRRLHDTIRNLNRAHQVSLIRFSGDGTGAGVLWEKLG